MLQAWKWKTSTELIIDPEMDTSEKCNLDIPDSTNEQLDLNEKCDVISALR